MTPPIFSVCVASAAVRGLLGEQPTKLFPFGSVPDGITRPYAVWRSIGGQPENLLGDVPDIDQIALQIDCYADTVGVAHGIALALRDAIEPHAYITAGRGDDRDPETRSYRYSFDVDWFVNR